MSWADEEKENATKESAATNLDNSRGWKSSLIQVLIGIHTRIVKATFKFLEYFLEYFFSDVN